MVRFGVAGSRHAGSSRNPSFARTPGGRPRRRPPCPSGSSATRNASGSTASPPRSSPATSRPTSSSPAPTAGRFLARPRAANRLGFALQLGTLRFLGFCPDDLSTAPEAVVAFVAQQLDVAPGELARYGRRGQTRTEHLRQIRRYLGFRKATAGDLAQLEPGSWTAPWSTTDPPCSCAWPASTCSASGSNGRGSLIAVQRFDLATHTAKIVARLPRPLSDIASASTPDGVYLVGGYDGHIPRREIYRTSDGIHFHEVALLPVGLRYPAVAALGDTVVIAGGTSIAGASDSIYLFNTKPGVLTTSDTSLLRRRMRRHSRSAAPSTSAAASTLPET